MADATRATGEREQWSSRAGFVFAAIGSAVGLGNMWRFAYKASEGGGAAFVVVYIVFVLLVGMPLMTSEFVIGRLTQESPARALRRLGYESREVQEIVEHVDEHDTIEGAPHLRDDDLSVFDCAFKPASGTRSCADSGSPPKWPTSSGSTSSSRP